MARVRDCDVVLDCTDNFATRHAINRACVAHRVPLVSGAAIRFDGTGERDIFDVRRGLQNERLDDDAARAARRGGIRLARHGAAAGGSARGRGQPAEQQDRAGESVRITHRVSLSIPNATRSADGGSGTMPIASSRRARATR